jgi:sugar transferase (PEP-CTERM/EpsH1 system associated)
MHVVHALRAGGMELGVVKLVNGLDDRRVASAICSTAQAGELKRALAPGVRLFELGRRDGNNPKLVWQLYRLFRRERPHIVHTHAWGTLLEGLVAARLAGVPAVVHGEHGTLQLRRHQRLAQRCGWAAANRVLSVSSRLAERIERETGFPAARIRTIRNGVDLARFSGTSRSRARRALGLPERGVLAATVGRLVPVKDHVTLLEATAALRQEGHEFTLVVAGDGPLRADLMARALSLGLSGRVRWLGHRSDVESVFAAADLFVLSSKSEGLSNTILEAMASGLPVVATRVGGADEMVVHGQTGLLVPPESPSELARALGALAAGDARRAAMGAAGRARVEAEFSLEGMLQQYEALYRDVAAAGPVDPAGAVEQNAERSGAV